MHAFRFFLRFIFFLALFAAFNAAPAFLATFPVNIDFPPSSSPGSSS